jgi:hypothetical protein
MSTKTSSARKPMPASTITAKNIRHFVGEVEVASVPEMVARLITEDSAIRPDTIYNIIHAQRTTLLPKPEIYGTSYLYPAEALGKVVLEIQSSLASKAIEKNSDVQKLLSKIKSNPELTKVLLGLLD